MIYVMHACMYNVAYFILFLMISPDRGKSIQQLISIVANIFFTEIANFSIQI